MALSLYWPGKYHYYPIGNTSAVCLTRDVAPETSANILLLACGDPRNVLYTVFCETQNMGRTLDFTCCDFDPGVLARNILLLTMIMDGAHEDVAWNTFYHMYLDSESRSALVTHSQKLASYSTIEAWRSSPYGATIRMGTDHTLIELRRYWGLYADFYDQAKSQPERFSFLRKAMNHKRNMAMGDRGHSLHFSSSRSSGPLLADRHTVILSSEQFENYWKTGTTFTDADRLATSTHLNATFFHSRAHDEGFDVHYGTDPMIPFHPAPFFGDTNRSHTVEDLVEFAKSQFCEWCAAFRTVAMVKRAKGALVVRFLLGDALAVSRALQVWPSNAGAQAERTCTAFVLAQWSACSMALNPEEYTVLGAPVRFDVVDTSNLCDDIGIHNILLCATPLLAKVPTAVLYTESLLTHTENPVTEFQTTLFADLSIIALLLDLAPVDALSGFTTRCNTHEWLVARSIIPLTPLNKSQYHQTFTWKRPTSGDPSVFSLHTTYPAFSIDALTFGHLLHKIYTHLFEHEDPTYVEAQTSRANISRAITRASSWCPSRESFVMLLTLIRARAQVPNTQWSDVIRTFLDVMRNDAIRRHPFDILSHNETSAQLYRYGLYTVPGIDNPRRPTGGRLSRWPTIPPLVRIFLTVPRESLANLKSVFEELPTPWLHCSVKIPRGEHAFQSVDSAYGSVVDNGTIAVPEISIVEDHDSPTLVFSFVVPGRLLTEVAPDGILIRLAVRTNPTASMILTPILGSNLAIFTAPLEDTEHVHLAPEQPLSPQPFSHIASTPSQGDRFYSSIMRCIGTQQPVHITLDSTERRIASLVARLEIENTEAKASIADGATPHVSQMSPCTMQVALGIFTQTLVYPLPIVGSQHKVRIARKSFYIEVVVPVAIPFSQPDGYKLNPFPIVRVNKGATAAWNLHRVPLDRLPVLNISSSNAAMVGNWYNTNVGSQMSARESALKATQQRDVDVLANLKDTIHFIMLRSAGTQRGPPARVIALTDDVTDNSDTLFFVHKIRFDVAAHTVVCDAFVLTHFAALMKTIYPLYSRLVARRLVSVRVYGEEMRAWKRLLPSLVERCRTGWTHSANCEYVAHGRIPLELETGEGDPLCSCGRGKDVDGMLQAGDALWAEFAPFVTRVAISPLFAVSYLEQDIGRGAEGGSTSPAQGYRSGGVNASVARCAKCWKEESSGVKLLRCSRCTTTLYCSQACQKIDWKTHKLQCKK